MIHFDGWFKINFKFCFIRLHSVLFELRIKLSDEAASVKSYFQDFNFSYLLCEIQFVLRFSDWVKCGFSKISSMVRLLFFAIRQRNNPSRVYYTSSFPLRFRRKISGYGVEFVGILRRHLVQCGLLSLLLAARGQVDTV